VGHSDNRYPRSLPSNQTRIRIDRMGVLTLLDTSCRRNPRIFGVQELGENPEITASGLGIQHPVLKKFIS